MKILVLMGNLRSSSQTKRAVEMFEGFLKGKVSADFEYVFLKDLELGACKGCALCLSKGEASCPHKDGLSEIIKKMEGSDGVIFASPNFALQVTHVMKNFLDRMAFFFHRPRFFHKPATSIISQGVYGGKKIEEYLRETEEFWGFIPVKGTVVTPGSAAYHPGRAWTEAETKDAENKLKKLADRFAEALKGDKSPAPSFFRVMIFSASRTGHRLNAEDNYDKQYFKEKGWFESDYFYPVRLNPLKKLCGNLFDMLVKKASAAAGKKKDTPAA